MGARPMARVIQEHIKKPLADEVLFGRLKSGGHVRVVVVTDENGNSQARLRVSRTVRSRRGRRKLPEPRRAKKRRASPRRKPPGGGPGGNSPPRRGSCRKCRWSSADHARGVD
jgi:ATP-dependent Clp protease ATP-binding subunit ClpA